MGGMGIQICVNKGAGLIRVKIRKNLIKSSKLFFSLTIGQNTLILSMEHPWGKEIQFCSNKVPRVMYGPTPRA